MWVLTLRPRASRPTRRFHSKNCDPHGVTRFSPRPGGGVGPQSNAGAQILERLSRLQARLDEGLLRVAVLGQFKRGKSTLLNALLGAPVVPIGVTPVTAIPTSRAASGKTTLLRVIAGMEAAAGFRRRES
jgi:ribosome biogenesis GTPase A